VGATRVTMAKDLLLRFFFVLCFIYFQWPSYFYALGVSHGAPAHHGPKWKMAKRCFPQVASLLSPLLLLGRWKSSPPIRHTKFPLSTFITIRCLCIINYIRDKIQENIRDIPHPNTAKKRKNFEKRTNHSIFLSSN